MMMNTKKVLLFLLPLITRSSAAFAPAVASTKRTFVTASTVTQLHATPPTMVVYWTIKSSIDLAAYGLGKTDKFQGTGVWKGVQFEREKKDEEPSDAAAKNVEAEKKEPAKSTK
jgi:hypothetical protein